jgi:DNA polymerase-3 subunit beta
MEVEFSCPREALWFGVKTVGRALGAGRGMPILGGIKLELTDDALTLQATDLERAIICTIPAENRGDGPRAVLVNGELLTKVASRLPEGEVLVRTVEEKVELSCGGVKIDLLTMPLEDYPEIPKLPELRSCAIPREQLQQGLDQTTFAALSARETSRLSLTGVDMILQEDKLRLVATNGYRLALKEEPLPTPPAEEGEYLVSSDSLKELLGILAQVEAEEVELYLDEQKRNLFFKAGEVIFIAKLLQEEYPDFERVIPRENRIGLHLERLAFLEALQRVEITAAEESGAVILEVREPALTALAISSQSAEKGEAEEVLRLLRPAEEPIKISFKAEYLIEALKKMDSAEVTFWLEDPESAGLLEPSPPGGFIYVCMPIRMG